MIDNQAPKELLVNLSATKENFLRIARKFSQLPIKLYFLFKEKYEGEEFILPLKTGDGTSGKPRRSFRAFDPNSGPLIFSLRHNVADWFDVMIGTPDSTSGEITSITPIISLTFWELKGVAGFKKNSFYMSFGKMFDGIVSEKEAVTVMKKLLCEKSFSETILGAMFTAID